MVRPVLLAGLVGWLVIACSSGNSSSGGLLPDGGRAPGNGGSNANGTGNGNGTSAPRARGQVTFYQSQKSGGGSSDYELSVSAMFTDGATMDDANECVVKKEGACSVSTCAKTDGGIAPASLRSAGAIQVTGLAAPVSLSPKSDKSYETYHATSSGVPYVSPGAKVHVSAAGADVPKFDADVTVGPALTVTAPQFNGLFTPLPKGDVNVAWSGNGASDRVQVMVQANAASDGSKTVMVTCDFTGSSGVIPKSVMDQLATPGAMTVGTFNTTVVTAGAYEVSVGAFHPDAVGLYTK